jgi:hypothetical protein
MASYKERSRDMNTINLALYAASIAMPNVNETNLPKCTIPVLNLFADMSSLVHHWLG